MNYYHWAPQPVELRAMKYPQGGHPKPNGLWFDVDGDWKRWCEKEEFRLEDLRCRHIVTILDPARVLLLNSAGEIDSFTRKYGHNVSMHVQPLQSAEELNSFKQEYGLDFFGDIQKAFSHYILWQEVAEQFSGIIINPYLREKSESYLWYWGWNCAGGCIWDTSIIRLGRPHRME